MAENFTQSEPKLLDFTGHFGRSILAAPAEYGLTADQATQYQTTRDRFVQLHELCQSRVTRSPANIFAKNEQKKTLVNATRMLVDVVQAWPPMTNDKRAVLGITVRDRTPRPVPRPTERPRIAVTGVSGHDVTVELTREDGRRGRPANAAQATLLSFVGESPSANPDDWRFEGNTTKAATTVEVSTSVPAGSRVWVTAFWSNRRAQSGPPAEPVSAFVQFGGMARAA